MRKLFLNIGLLMVVATFINAIPVKSNQDFLEASKSEQPVIIFGSPLELNIIQVEPSDKVKLDGELKITVKGGKAPYTLTVHTNTRTKELSYKGESFDLKELGKGVYFLIVTDSEGNLISENINL